MVQTLINNLSYSTLDATKLSGNLPALNGSSLTNISAGKIGQVIYGQTAARVDGSGGGTVDSGLSASITPSASSSTILVLVTQQVLKGNTSSAGQYVQLQLQRQVNSGGYSTIKFVTSLGVYIAGTSSGDKYIGAEEYSLNLVDAPNTTNQVDYKTIIPNDSGIQANPDDTGATHRGEASMILMELLA